jgi:cytochrome c oxidase cbb3-type subunit 3
VGLACLLTLVFGIYFGREAPAQKHEDPVWDDDLEEGNNPAPLWWFWLILAAMVFSVVYLMLYPGLGKFSGALHWSQQSQLDEHHAQHTAQHDPARHELMLQSFEQLAANEVAMDTAARLFKDNCAACHGADARGQAKLFPDLRDGDWLWGGSAEQVEQTIRNGRMPVMPPWLAALKEEGVAQVATYVKSMRTPQADELPGKMLYQQFCIACHGAEGAGNPLLGAPRINDDIWLYGGDDATLRKTIAEGRNGQMPAFAKRLDDVEIRLLVAWILRPQDASR